MSENEKNDSVIAGDESAKGKKKGGKMKIIIVAIVVLLLGGGAGGFYYWRTASVAAADSANKKATDKKSRSNRAAESPDGEPGVAKSSVKSDDPLENALPNDDDVKKIVELLPFIVNLANTDQAHYLRMTVTVGIGGEAHESEKPDQLFITRVRNAMLAVLSTKTSDDVLSVEGKTKLRKELLAAAKAASDDPEVIAIYITDFIVQL